MDDVQAVAGPGYIAVIDSAIAHPNVERKVESTLRYWAGKEIMRYGVGTICRFLIALPDTALRMAQTLADENGVPRPGPKDDLGPYLSRNGLEVPAALPSGEVVLIYLADVWQA